METDNYFGNYLEEYYGVGLLNAAVFAASKHKHQFRKDADHTPYINYPLGVALILSKEAKIADLTTLQAALLHDVIEDTETTAQEIEDQFGATVRSIVQEVTDNKGLTTEQRKRYQVEHASHLSDAAKVIKIADKIYNVCDLLNASAPSSWSAERIQGYCVWAKAVTDGIKSVNVHLGRILDATFNRTFVRDGVTYDAIPKTVDLNEFLESYYKSFQKSD